MRSLPFHFMQENALDGAEKEIVNTKEQVMRSLPFHFMQENAQDVFKEETVNIKK